MAELRSENLQGLLMQAQYAPPAKRLSQLNACDTLIRIIKPDRTYPYDFVCFHLTGYHPRPASTQSAMLSYADLLHDIPLYAATLSQSMHLLAKDVSQKMYTLEQLASRFNVSKKTLSRWRTKGLVGRYVFFADGRQRLAFLAPTVEHFRRRNRRNLVRSKNFSHISPDERRQIIAWLTRLGQRCPDRRQDAIRRIAKRFGRSVEAVRRLLAAHERTLAAAASASEVVAKRTVADSIPTLRAAFERRSGAVGPDEQEQIANQFARGIGIDELVRRFHRGRSTIYRIVRLEQAREARRHRVEYMPCSDFSLPTAEQRFCQPPPDLTLPVPAEKAMPGDGPTTGALETYAADILRTPLLTHRQERFLFAKYNFLKYSASQLQEQIDPVYPRAAVVDRTQRMLAEADQIKDLLIRSNLRLVVSVARKHVRHDSEMLEFISEGNVALMNAVEKFDFARGVKFSTYATWAIIRRFASAHRTPAHPAVAVDAEALEVVRDLRLADSKVMAVESARKGLQEVMSETLDEREQVIVREHYGLTDKTELIGQRKPRSLREIAAMLGLSKEGIRRVELVALQKMRRVLTREQFDLLTGY